MGDDVMRAAVYHGAGDIRIEQRPVPSPSAGELLVRVLRSGLCGTDVTEWSSGPHMIPLTTRHPHSTHSGPMIPGHEIVGEVVSAPGDSEFTVGTRVVSGAQVPCGTCARCTEGRVNICEQLYSLGLNANGGHAEYLVGPVGSFVAVPPALDLDAAGLTQPLAVGLHAARRSGARAGDSVLVSGAGAIGSFVIAGLRFLEPTLHITATDIDEVALARAQRIGADEIVVAGSASSHSQVFDVTIEASGAPGTLAACLDRTRRGGCALVVGMPARPVELDMYQLVLKEITITTTVALIASEDLTASLQILASTNLASEMLESVRPLTEITAVLEAMSRGTISGKVLLDPTGETP